LFKTFRRLLAAGIVSALVIAALGVWVVAPARAEDQKLCDQIGGVSNNAITATGSLNNIYQFDQTGSSFCRVLIHDSAYSVETSAIGVQALIDRGPTQAVDVFGLLSNGIPADTFLKPVRICLRGSGEVLFLAASDDTRAIQSLFGWEANPGYTCADVFSPGIVALAAPLPPSPEEVATNPDIAGDVNNVTPLTNCTVTTTYGVFLRREPSLDARIRYQFKGGVELPASGRTGSWFLVTFLKKPGWINAAFVTPTGDCGQTPAP
jgi:hypothetical protein